MRSRLLALSAVSLLALAACKPVTPPADNAMQGDGSSSQGTMMEGDDSSVAMEGNIDMDAVIRMDGMMMMQRDGQMMMVENSTVLENGVTVMTDGTVTKPDGTSMMMEDGMMMDMDGMMHMMDAETQMMMKQRSLEAPGMMEHEGMGQGMMDGEAVTEASYAAYTPEVLTNGETKVLFFHAAWCPVCKVANTSLQTWYAAEEFARSVYKVDYDTEADLKAKYGVTYQHTFVVVDGQGNMITKIQGPTDDQLRALLRG